MDGYLLELPHLDSLQKGVLLCAGVLTIVYTVMRPFKKRKDPLAKTSDLSLAGQRAVEKQMTELLVELEQMSRQMMAQLETRATKLELLLREADEKIAILRGLPGTPARHPVRHDLAPGLASPADARHAEVYALSDGGRSSRQIAQQLGRPYGEIELILALRGHQKAEMSA